MRQNVTTGAAIAAKVHNERARTKNQRIRRSVFASGGVGLFSGGGNISIIKIPIVCYSRKEDCLWDCYVSLGVSWYCGHHNPLCIRLAFAWQDKSTFIAKRSSGWVEIVPRSNKLFHSPGLAIQHIDP